MKEIKAVIFDLDGTIRDTLPLCIKAFKRSIEPLINRSLLDAEIIATFGPSEEGTIMALAPEHYEKGVADYLTYYAALHDMCPTPFNGIIELLDAIKARGVRIAMVTGKGKHSTAISLQKFGLEGYFEIIETGEPSGPRKPEGIQQVLNHFGNIAKDEIIYVGDAPSDIKSSKQVGIPVVAAAWADTAEPDLLIRLQPNQIFFTLSDFSKWLIMNLF